MKIFIKDGLRSRLATIRAGRLSAFEAEIVGIPEGYTNVQASIGVAGSSNAYPCICTERRGGEWRLYANGAYFPTVGWATYHVTAQTGEGDGIDLGEGDLEVVASRANVTEATVPIVPPDFYVRNPTTGLWHKVTAEVNEDGEISMNVDQTGVTK